MVHNSLYQDIPFDFVRDSIQVIGHGAFAVVFKGRRTEVGRRSFLRTSRVKPLSHSLVGNFF